MTKRNVLLLALVLAQIAPPFAGTESVFADKHRSAMAKNPPGLTLQLEIVDGRAVYRQGELLQVHLRFSSTIPKTYRLEELRSSLFRLTDKGRDIFFVDRPGDAPDPLRDEFDTRMLCGMSMGRPAAVLKNDPTTLPLNLNEQIRFDKLGKFRLFVTSRRVTTENWSEVPVTSNMIELEIKSAEPEFSTRVLSESLAFLDSANSGRADQQRAARAIRFLGTEAAEREMVRRFKSNFEDVGWEFRLGLIGSARPAVVRQWMEEHLTAPEGAISSDFLDLLALLEVNADLAGRPLDARRAAHWEYVMAAGKRLANAIDRKRGPDRTSSLETALVFASGTARRKLILEQEASIAAMLPGEQYRKLTDGWPGIGQASILPLLRKLYETWTDMSRNDDDQTGRHLRGIALVRIHELSPDEGRKLIVNEIGRSPGAELKLLGSLPDPSVPEPEGPELWVAPLVAQYGTAAIKERVLAMNKAAAGKKDCMTQQQYLTYFLRVDPSTAARLVGEDWSRSSERACLGMLSDAVRHYWSPQLESVALEHLDDRRVEVASQSALLLGRSGSSSVEGHLWRRLEKWSAEWKGRSRELESHPMEENEPHAREARLESNLANAIRCGSAWFATPQKLSRLRQLCITGLCKSLTEPAHEPFPIEVTHSVYGKSWLIRVGGCYLFELAKLKPKLAQFPSGTVFQYQADGVGWAVPDKRDFLLDLTRFVEARGMRIEMKEIRAE